MLAGFFASVRIDRSIADGDLLHSPERRRGAVEGRHRVIPPDPECSRREDGGGRVVRTGRSRQTHAQRPDSRHVVVGTWRERELEPAVTVHALDRDGEVQRRPMRAAGWTRPGTKSSRGRPLVHESASARRATGHSRGSQTAAITPHAGFKVTRGRTGCIDPEPSDRPSAPSSTRDPTGDQFQARVVGAHDDRSLGREAGEVTDPPVLDHVELAVAIELVAKQIEDDDDVRTERVDDSAERHLVDLEDRVAPSTVGARAAIGDHRGDQALSEVCAGAIGDWGRGRLVDDLCDQPGRRCLAVRAKHDNDLSEFGAQLGEDGGIEPFGHESREGGPMMAEPSR